jgi:predicted metal-dependent peptidase
MAGDVETKLAAARARLILEKPFLGALVLRLPLLEADPQWCPTSATDARSIYYCRQYIDDLSLGQVQFVLAHEALHCALSHFARRQHRERRRWDVACDLAINPLLSDDGLEAPPGALLDEDFAGLTAEEIYPCLESGDEREPMDRHLYNAPQDGINPGSCGRETSASAANTVEHPAAGQPGPLNNSEREALAVQWQQRLAGAAQAAMRAGKLNNAMARLVDHLLQPQLPWRSLLDRYLSATAHDDYNYMRPSSRRDGDAIMPSLRSSQTDIVVALDTSGSIKHEEITEFAAEIDAIKGQVKARVTLLACAAQLSEDGPWTFEPWESFELPRRFAGSGGTNFIPVFDWVRNTGRTPDLLIYFTDARGEFPEVEPSYPTMWLVKGREPVPWGRRIQLN